MDEMFLFRTGIFERSAVMFLRFTLSAPAFGQPDRVLTGVGNMDVIKQQKVVSRVRRKTGYRKVILILLCVAVIQFAAVIGLIFACASSDPETETDYLLILGAAVIGDEPSPSLYERLKTGTDYLERHPDTIVIVSGGQGKGEEITEAEAMRRYLVAAGIDESRIITEPRASNTNENFKFSKKLVEQRSGVPAGDITFVTNGYHILRSRMLAGRNGLKAHALASENVRGTAVMYLREYFALIKSFLFDW